MIAIAEAEYSLFGAGLFLIAAGATEGCIKLVFVKRLLERLGFHDIGVLLAAVREGVHPGRYALCIGVYEKLETEKKLLQARKDAAELIRWRKKYIEKRLKEAEEEMEEKRIKKLKLRLKDEMARLQRVV